MCIAHDLKVATEIIHSSCRCIKNIRQSNIMLEKNLDFICAKQWYESVVLLIAECYDKKKNNKKK